MIEVTVKDFLKGKLNIPVYLEQPKTEPTKYILIEKTGSGKENQVNSAKFAIQSYAKSLFDAAELNEQMKEAMEDIIYDCDISAATLNSDYNFTDTTTKRYRYQAVYEFYY